CTTMCRRNCRSREKN
ncbi:Phosphoglucosamine mutase, partial [Haemophilus influenzae]